MIRNASNASSTSKTFTKYKKINSIFISVFCYENKEKHPICIKDVLWRKHVDLLLIDEGEKALYLSKTLILA